MKILQIGKFFPIVGGVEKVMYDIVEGVSKRGITCDMFCASTFDEKKNQEVVLNEHAKIFVNGTVGEVAKTKISVEFLKNLRKIGANYDIIHLHHPDPLAALALFLSNYKGKVIVHWHSDILSQKFLLKLFKPLQNWLINRADLILGTTEVYVQNSPDLVNVQHKVKSLPIGIEDNSSQYDQETYNAIKESYNGKKLVFSVGRLVPYKGFEYLIDAATYLDDDYVILIGGKGHLHDNLQQRIKEKGLQDKVKLLGYLDNDEMNAYFKACDVFCLSSTEKTEAFAIVQIEAMSFCKPIVSTRIPGSGVSWVNKNDETGYTVAVKDTVAISEGIKKVCSNQETYEQFCKNSRLRYEMLFTREKMIDNVLDLYKGILSKTN